MERLFKHMNADGSWITVHDAGTLPDITFIISTSHFQVSVPEGFFAHMVNRINLGPNFGDLPGEVRHLGDSDSAQADDQQV